MTADAIEMLRAVQRARTTPRIRTSFGDGDAVVIYFASEPHQTCAAVKRLGWHIVASGRDKDGYYWRLVPPKN